MGRKSTRMSSVAIFAACAYLAIMPSTYGQGSGSTTPYLESNRDRGANIDIRLRADKASVRAGETISFTVMTDHDCYLTVVYPGRSGRVLVLWPNRGSGPDNRVQAGQAVQIPGPNAGFQLKVDGTAPFESIEAYATSAKDAVLREQDFRIPTGTDLAEFVGTPDELARTFGTRTLRLPPGIRWGTAYLKIPMVGSRELSGAPLPARPFSEMDLAPSSLLENEISTINNEIQRKGFGWRAGWTPLSDLSDYEFAKLCGAQEDDPSVPDVRDLGGNYPGFLDRTDEMEAQLPPSWNWANVQGKNWMTPVRNQKSCGACVSFGILAAIEANYQIRTQHAVSDLDLAEGHLFFCGCGKCCKPGWQEAKALTWLKGNGVVDEASYPYEPSDQECQPDRCKSSAKHTFSIKDFRRILKSAEAKNWLRNVGPLVGSMDMYSDFRHYKGGTEPYKPVKGKALGGHCICIVGYNDTKKCWIAKNSWGTEWGDQGYVKIAYDQCRILTKARPFFGIGEISIKQK